MKSFFFILLAHAFCLGLASHLPYGEDFMGDYMFGYGVYANEYDQKQNFGQKEHRNENEVMGQYHVLLPDGRVQTVRYYVDKYSGFIADVSYEAQAPKYEPE